MFDWKRRVRLEETCSTRGDDSESGSVTKKKGKQ